jgi:hypothetical protein
MFKNGTISIVYQPKVAYVCTFLAGDRGSKNISKKDKKCGSNRKPSSSSVGWI